MRWFHIVLGLILLCYVYSPFHQYWVFQFLVKWIALPVLTMSGIFMWKPKLWNKIFKTDLKS